MVLNPHDPDCPVWPVFAVPHEEGRKYHPDYTSQLTLSAAAAQLFNLFCQDEAIPVILDETDPDPVTVITCRPTQKPPAAADFLANIVNCIKTNTPLFNRYPEILQTLQQADQPEAAAIIAEAAAKTLDAKPADNEAYGQQRPTTDMIPAPQLLTATKQIIARRAEIMNYPVDKVNGNIWRLMHTMPLNQFGLQQVLIAAESAADKKKGVEVTTTFAISFDSLGDDMTITRALTAYDKRVYQAIGALRSAGNTTTTATQIHYAMGNTSKPAQNQIVNIMQSIQKMRHADIILDNTQEADRYKYKRHYYTGYLLPIPEFELTTVNGRLTDAAIPIPAKLPLLDFALDRKQVTTVPMKLLQSPVSKTEQNLDIDDYLIERIARAKAGSESKVILIATICEKTGVTTVKQRQRLPDKLAKLLDHYTACGWIAGYTLTADKIDIKLPVKNEPAPQPKRKKRAE